MFFTLRSRNVFLKNLEFEDFDHQFYQLISDENNIGVAGGTPWKNSNIPSEYAITDLGPVFVRVSQMEPLQLLLEQTLEFKLTDQTGAFSLFEVGQGGNGASIIVEQRADLPKAIEGFGNIHHLALRVADEEALRHWIHVINQINVPSSGFVDRFYFQSEYFLAATHVLFELATDGPGFLEMNQQIQLAKNYHSHHNSKVKRRNRSVHSSLRYSGCQPTTRMIFFLSRQSFSRNITFKKKRSNHGIFFSSGKTNK